MSWVLAFLGFAALVILHEAGHFAAAKAVGMRVERFSLFFGPLLFRFRRGETEYGIGPIPLGGYVRITGMNPHEELPPEVAPRAYFRQPVWKRVVVILAGPFVNLVLAFGIIWLVFHHTGIQEVAKPPRAVVQSVQRSGAAHGVLHKGDQILRVDGRRPTEQALRAAVNGHKCRGKARDGCRAATPVHLTVRRDGRRVALSARPRYDAKAGRMLLGFSYTPRLVHRDVSLGRAASLAVSQMWFVTHKTVEAIVRVFSPQHRKEISSVVGSYKVTQQEFSFSVSRALYVLGVISLSLAIINLFPFLPLDGGHVFWALAEKVRGRPIPFSVLERASVVGFALVLMLFFIGVTNDIDRLTGRGFNVR